MSTTTAGAGRRSRTRGFSVVASSTTPSTLSSLPTRTPPFAEIGAFPVGCTRGRRPGVSPEAWAMASSRRALGGGRRGPPVGRDSELEHARDATGPARREPSATSCAASASARPRSASFALLIATTVPDRGDDHAHDAGGDQDAQAPVGAHLLPQLGLGHARRPTSMKSRSRSERSGVESATQESAAREPGALGRALLRRDPARPKRSLPR